MMKFIAFSVVVSSSLRHRGARLNPSESVETSVKSALDSADKAEKTAELNAELVVETRGFGAQAEVAARAAKDSYHAVKAEIARITAEAKKTAMKAAEETLQQVKDAAAAGLRITGLNKAKAESDAELAAANAAATAAEPYHAAMLRAQKLVVEYNTRAQELAAASNNLVAQGQQLAGNANHYQFMGQPVQAQQMMMQAHSLFNQGDTMGKQARELHAVAAEVNAGIPAYQLAATAAAASAAAEVNPPLVSDEGTLPY
eukprot:GEMP01067443.1.p1 GENE.GEMP01067443.1~~GEMP01067443.1.p1  ORF type:complete len:258 (+),score=83.92 GEMP01067443.1:125-898(+)